MDIAAMSMAFAQSNVSVQASLAVTKKAMDTSEVQMQGIVDMLQTAAPPSGHQLDIRA
ncbi:MAG: putative motility protein [Ruminococcaceae bacterium]|nr:putative motility protein [Oscillospiraceae bacterium]